MPDPSMPPAAHITLILCLILINAFFYSAETAIDSVNKSKIKTLAQNGNKKAVTLLNYMDEPNNFLPTIQVLVTFSGFLACGVAAIGFSRPLAEKLTDAGIPFSIQLSFVAITILFSFIFLVFSKMYPKEIALRHSEGIALAMSGVICAISVILKPFAWMCAIFTKLLLIITGQKAQIEEGEFSEDDVMSMLEVGCETGVLKEEGQKMINSIFAFDDKLAYEIMTPRTDVFYFDINDPVEKYIDELMELKYSRIPVCDDDSDNIIGILHIKDYLIKARESGFENVDIRGILRKPFRVPETKNIDSLFFELQGTKQHIAILYDEYGGFSGIVTMEDIIEEVMGDITDEYDEMLEGIEELGDGEYRLDGSVSLDDFDEATGLTLTSENSETLGGLLLEILGEIPDEESSAENLVVEYMNCIFTIESVKERRIEKVHLKIRKIEEDPLITNEN